MNKDTLRRIVQAIAAAIIILNFTKDTLLPKAIEILTQALAYLNPFAS